MDFRPTDAQRLLVGVAREFLDKACPLAFGPQPARVDDGVREDVWRRLSDLGWPGLLVPARFGGSEASLLDVVFLVEEMGRAALASPYVSSAVVSTAILATAGTREQQERLLPAMALGDRFCTLAIVEEAGRLRPESIRLPIEIGGAIDGVKRFVRDAHVAQHLLVVGRGRGGFDVVVIEADRAGVRIEPRETMAGERLSTVALERVPVRSDDLVGPEGGAWPIVESALALGTVARAAEMVGAAQRILDLAVEHAKVRVQSGRPIGSFQAIQHACADLLRDVEVSRGLVHHAAWSLDAGRDAATAVAMAKAYAARACLAVARRAHQVFGAIGYCEEHPLHLLHKRIHAAAVDFGDRTAHLETVARAIGLG